VSILKDRLIADELIRLNRDLLTLAEDARRKRLAVAVGLRGQRRFPWHDRQVPGPAGGL
jgi:hypothetical protein